MTAHGYRLLAGGAVLVLGGWLLPLMAGRLGLDTLLPGPAVGILAWSGAAALGGFIARTGFLPVALVLWAAVWKLALLALYQIAAPAGGVSVLALLQFNALPMALSLAATVVGTLLGQRVATRGRRGPPDPVVA